ncbi:MAG: FecR domain-containing protein, partial [Planctomycetota bacterium]|nr:FecR domain-containing protein [Planctomycetota bacterium]
MNKSSLVLLAAAFLVSPLIAYGQESKPSPDPAGGTEVPSAGQPAAEEFVVTVKEVAGTVEVQSGGQGDWVPAVVGMRFGEGANVCVGFKSGIILQFGDAGVVMLKDLAQVKVDRLFRDASAVDAQLSLTVGRAAVYVKKQEIRTEFRVSTPKLTAAVKGSFIDMTNAPDYGLFIGRSFGEISLTDIYGVEYRIGESVSRDSELGFVAQAIRNWTGEYQCLDRMSTDTLLQMIRDVDGVPAEQPSGPGVDLLRWAIDPYGPESDWNPTGHGWQPAPFSGFDDLGVFPNTDWSPVPGWRPAQVETTDSPASGQEAYQSGLLPAYGGSQFGAQVDQLAAMGYSGLAYYLRHDGATCPAVADVSCFSSSYSSQPAKVEWMW